MNEATKTDNTFRVWVSTYGLYNSGIIAGYWCPAEEAPLTVSEFTAGLIEAGYTITPEAAAVIGSEIWCFDAEHSPIGGEMSPGDARAIAEALEAAEIPEEELPAFAAYAYDQNSNTAEDIERAAANWSEIFLGFFDSAEDYAAQYIEDTGMLSEMPESLRGYFDYAAYAQDMVYGGDIAELSTDTGETFIINSNA